MFKLAFTVPGNLTVFYITGTSHELLAFAAVEGISIVDDPYTVPIELLAMQERLMTELEHCPLPT
jgi:hypothetical protein